VDASTVVPPRTPKRSHPCLSSRALTACHPAKAATAPYARKPAPRTERITAKFYAKRTNHSHHSSIAGKHKFNHLFINDYLHSTS